MKVLQNFQTEGGDIVIDRKIQVARAWTEFLLRLGGRT